MAPQNVGEIKDRWPAIRAGVENREYTLEVAIQVHHRNYLAVKLQQIVARVPPAMSNACRQGYGSPAWHSDPLCAHYSTQCSRFYDPLLVFLSMHVQRRAVRSRRKSAFQD